MQELINNAFSGVNIIPTMFLVVILIYWLSVIFGILDLDLLDFDIDFDTGDGGDAAQSILAFLNLKEVPIMVVLSILSLFFWVASMFLCKTVENPGGLINALLMIPLFILCVLFTKIITNPLKGIFRRVNLEATELEGVNIGETVVLISEIKDGRIGQGEIEKDSSTLKINLKAENKNDIFNKYEKAYISKKDNNKNIYYIIKIRE